MRCLACHKRLPDDAVYCAYCGAAQPPAPGPLAGVALDGQTLRGVLLGLGLGSVMGLLFWLLAGALSNLAWDRRAILGLLVGALGGSLSGLLQGEIFWPLRFQPALILTHWRLAMLYGALSSLAIIAGGIPIGLIVLALGWRISRPSMEAFIAGTSAGLVSLVAGVPLGAVVGLATGYAASRLGRRLRGPMGVALAAGLAWVNGAAAGGAFVGGLVANRAELDLSTGVYTGAVMQAILAALLLPLGIRLARRLYIFTARWP
jgi:hypothetical protein